jgi:hypothetical protein
MSGIHVGDCNCNCCDDEAASVPAEFHRDLVTGDVPAAPNETLDAVEQIWRCDDGDITGLTQETVLINCTGTAAVTSSNINGPDATPGSLKFTFDDIAPTADEFHAVQILWTGATFDAFSHVAHIAAGSLSVYGTRRNQSLSESPPVDSVAWPAWGDRPATDSRWGVCVRVNGLIFFFSADIFGAFYFPFTDRCWHAQNSANTRVITATGELRSPTTAELRAAGLTVDAIATQQTHEVGVCVILQRTDIVNGYLGAVTNPPAPSTVSAAIGLDTVGIYATYTLGCAVAFVNQSTLTLSTPAHSGSSNCEPHELRGISVPLTLNTMPTFDSSIHSPILSTVYDHGYAYTGSTTVATNQAGQGGASETATVEVWYAPCRQLLMRFTVPSRTYDGWISIDHSDEQSSDPCNGSGDTARGHATAPTFAGHFQRDIRLPCQSAGVGDRLSVPWYGSDCVDRSNETSWVSIHGIVGKCQQAMPGKPDPVCTTGLLPNQLPQLTDCYSLDPIAIGYRRRITNNFSFGGFGPCGSANAPLDKSYPNNTETHVAAVTNPFTATAGSSTVEIALPAHGFTAFIPGSSGIVALETTDALFDFVLNSGLWASVPPGSFIGASGFWKYKDANTVEIGVTINNGGGAVSFPATSSGSGGGAFTFDGRQSWGHDCKLHVLDDMGFAFGTDSVIGVGSQLVGGFLYFDITE